MDGRTDKHTRQQRPPRSPPSRRVDVAATRYKRTDSRRLSVRPSLRWSLTLCGLQILSAACSEELTQLEMQINEKRRYACGLVHALAHYLNNFGIILFV